MSTDKEHADHLYGHMIRSRLRQKMIDFLRKHYPNTLGEDIKLLDEPGGLEKLFKKYCTKENS